MVAAVFLAVGLVGIFFSLFAVPLAQDGSVAVAVAPCIGSAAVALVSGFFFRGALAKERSGAFVALRSLPWMTLGVTLLVLGGTASAFVGIEGQRQLAESGPQQIQTIQGAIADVSNQKSRLQAEGDLYRSSENDPAWPRDRAFEMELLRRIGELDSRLRELRQGLDVAERAPLLLTTCLVGAGTFALACVATFVASVTRKITPGLPPWPETAPPPGMPIERPASRPSSKLRAIGGRMFLTSIAGLGLLILAQWLRGWRPIDESNLIYLLMFVIPMELVGLIGAVLWLIGFIRDRWAT